MQGMVKWFSIKKGFGFIKSQGKDYFVHISELEKNSKLDKGDKVSFEAQQAPKGVKAVKVRKIPDFPSKEAHRGSNQRFCQVR